MTNQDIKHRLRRLLSYNTLSSVKRDEVKQLLNKLESTNDPSFPLFQSKYLFIDRKYDDAKDILCKLMSDGRGDFSVYYGLYKIAIKQRKFEEAYEFAAMCEETKTDSDLDFSLSIALAQVTMEYEKDPASFDASSCQATHDKYIYFSDRAVNTMYEKAMTYFNEGNYIAARNEVCKLAHATSKTASSFNFYLLLENFDVLLEKQRQVFLQSIDGTNGMRTYDEECVDEAGCQRLLNYINKEISNDFTLAANLFFSNEHLFVKKVNPVIVYYVRKRISEKQTLMKLGQEGYKEYRDYIDKVKKAIKNGKYEEAIELCTLGRSKTGMPDFMYYEGKALYGMQKFMDAEKRFSGYLATGSYKAPKAMHYLANIYRTTGRVECVVEANMRITMINDYFMDESDYAAKSNGVGKKEAVSTNNKPKKGRDLSHDVRVAIDNISGKKLKVEDFDSYTFEEKMACIRAQNKNGNFALAERLTKKVSSAVTDPVQRKVINQEKGNVKLYKAKSKYGSK